MVLKTNNRTETWRQFRQHVTSRRFLSRNVVVLLIVLLALIYQGSPFWVYVLVTVLYSALMLFFQWIIALFWKEEEESSGEGGHDETR